MEFINSYKKLVKKENFQKKVRNKLKSLLIKHLSSKKKDNENENIIFPFWHHVFDDEIENFKIQIEFMKNYGDFISYDESITLLKEGIPKNQKYFCLSFDDGFKNIFDNVVEIFLKNKIPCTFFIPTSFIDNQREDSGQVFFNDRELKMEFLSWNECEKIVSEKLFDIGSHSVNHKLISKLSHDDCFYELKNSKNIIEQKLKVECKHFAPPVGDYSAHRDLDIVKKAKYLSLSTTERGIMNNLNTDAYGIKRHHLLANWQNYYLKYFFSY